MKSINPALPVKRARKTGADSPLPKTAAAADADAPRIANELGHESLGFLVRHTHRAFARVLADRLLEHDISPAQWTALRALWREDGYSQVDLAQRIHVEKASLTALLESLERKKLIRRERSEDDKRRWNVHLTKAGRALEAELLPFASQIDKQAVKGLSKEENATLRALLMKIWENLQ
jgi:DNA-binding MarR family transcriptional regulator